MITWRGGTNGVPIDDTSPIIGAIGSDLPSGDGQLIAPGESDAIGGTSRVHYGGGYIASSGLFQSAVLSLANGGVTAVAAGQIVLVDAGANEGLEVTVCGIVDGAPRTAILKIEEGAAETEWLIDPGSHWWAQTVDEAALSGSSDILVKIGTLTVGALRSPDDDWPTGLTTASSVYSLAVASSNGATLSASNRLTAPSGIGSWGGVVLPESDGSFPIGTIDATYRGIVLRRTIPAGMPAPPGGLPHVLSLSGVEF